MSQRVSIWLAAGMLVALSAGIASAQQPALRPIQLGGGGQSAYWLSTPQLLKELEIVDEQKTQLEKIRNESQTRMQELYKGLNEVPIAERGAKYAEIMKTLGDETEKKIQQVLLPHQVKRLNQIMLQMKMASMGYGYSPLGSDEFAKALNISDEQRAALKDKETEVRKEIAEKTAEFQKKLQSDAREKLLSVLNAEQRKTLDDLIGQKFEWGNPWAGGGVERKPGEK